MAPARRSAPETKHGTGTAAIGFVNSAEAVSGAGDKWLIDRLNAGRVALSDLDTAGVETLLDVHHTAQHLWGSRSLELTDNAENPTYGCVPLTNGQRLSLAHARCTDVYRLSRFAHMRLREGALVLENPVVSLRVTILQTDTAALFTKFAQGCTAKDIAKKLTGPETINRALGIVCVLRSAGIVFACSDDGTIPEDRDPASRQWEFHDAIFHFHSRMGVHDNPMGGQYRWRDILPPEPAVRENVWRDNTRELFLPDLATVARADPSFTEVLEFRSSRRYHNPNNPITFWQLGEFLYRAARIRNRYNTEFGEFTSRPYPSGGASYELELYLTINQCRGLDRGFYYYDPEKHAISLIAEPNDQMEALLDDAYMATGFQCRPQVLITLGSRFQRVSWKYSGIAYAVQLKNLGALLQTFYLVATAMGLSGCAVGCGDISRFARLTGIAPLVEGSIGEFLIGEC